MVKDFFGLSKPPHDKANASYFGMNEFYNPREFLPKGKRVNTKGLGLGVTFCIPHIEKFGVTTL